MQSPRPLTRNEISSLEAQGCHAEAWELVQVCGEFDPGRIQRAAFSGSVTIGSTAGFLHAGGVSLPCGIYDAAVSGCHIGDRVRISRAGLVRNYEIGEGVLIEEVVSLNALSGGSFGVGETLDVLNEGGGRSVLLYPGFNSQTAWLMAMLPQHHEMQSRLRGLLEVAASRWPREHGHIAAGAVLQGCGCIENVHVGAGAHLCGVTALRHATVLSAVEHPTFIGSGVQGALLLVAEGARIDTGALLEKCFVGQGVQIGKTLSAENSLFFANCEAFHSEIVSVFAGPYTVTHHRSTLLIASLFSFYNAGSGTNQSNHMYKLGPVHQGLFERGSKSGSFSYNLLESHIPAFSVVIGKHLANLDLGALPFSYITEEEGNSWLMPAINLFSIGTVRDGAKWPKRDRRKAAVKRDRIVFDIFSPWSVERLIEARLMLEKLYAETPRDQESLLLGGAHISRLMLRKGAKYYGLAIDRYLLGHIFSRITPLLAAGHSWTEVITSLNVAPANPEIRAWCDVGGLLLPRQHLLELADQIAAGALTTAAAVEEALDVHLQAYEARQWAYVCDAAGRTYERPLQAWSATDALDLLERWQTAAISLLSLTIEDARKEFAPFSRIGYGADQEEAEKDRDFLAVRGRAEEHSVIIQLQQERQEQENRYQQLKDLLTTAARQY